jgi:uncharacterized membrane protein YphA (DoxX/SURF4 family)
MDKLLLFLRVAVGCIFLYASKDKLFHPTEFADAVMGYRLLPAELITLVATVLPWLELLLGLGLVMGLLSVASAAWASLLSLGFLAGKASVIVRGLDVSCGCFSVSGASSISWSDLPANAILVAVTLLLWLKGPGCWTLDGLLLEDDSQAASGATD